MTDHLVVHCKREQERFWSKVDKNGPVPDCSPELGQCWTWTGYRMPKGYGTFRTRRPRRKVLAHRYAYSLEFGQPSMPQVMHRCDNPSCVRPSHLTCGTNQDNVSDMVAKGRNPRGVSHYMRRPGWKSSRTFTAELAAVNAAARANSTISGFSTAIGCASPTGLKVLQSALAQDGADTDAIRKILSISTRVNLSKP